MAKISKITGYSLHGNSWSLVGDLAVVGAADELFTGSLGPHGQHDTAKENISEMPLFVAALDGNGPSLFQGLFADFGKIAVRSFRQGLFQAAIHALHIPPGLQCIIHHTDYTIGANDGFTHHQILG